LLGQCLPTPHCFSWTKGGPWPSFASTALRHCRPAHVNVLEHELNQEHVVAPPSCHQLGPTHGNTSPWPPLQAAAARAAFGLGCHVCPSTDSFSSHTHGCHVDHSNFEMADKLRVKVLESNS